ncbi:MAG: NAD(P)H-binding protein [Geobacteraceae bacterium]|nr:NAD(P)H-binding protein [Geobacteraceae bacterium]
MAEGELHVVTGAFGFTGRFIARRLLAEGKRVRTLTGHSRRPDPFDGRVEVAPYDFHRPAALAASLRGAAVLYNTYWIRFPYGAATFEQAVENSRALFDAAAAAGVGRLVHISIINADPASPFPYFRWKGVLERAIGDSGLSHAIIRPALLFGHGDIMINNIAWLLRRYPLFAIPGAGDYRLQPIHVEDLAELAVRAARQRENLVLDAVGPEIYTFAELIRLIAARVGSRARIIHLPPALAFFLAEKVGRMVGDQLLTRDEAAGLMTNLLVSAAPPSGWTRLGDWLAENAASVGASYASELERHYR